MNQGCLLWAIECPTHPMTIWVKAGNKTETTAYWVVQAIIKVEARVRTNAHSHDQMGSNNGWTLLNIF